ncbi:MAG TPA: type II secretion system protein [Candidatus Paceibacterota bacterium]|nr:type II secretion system protein [Candidatus Paceibacterota bacterium]
MDYSKKGFTLIELLVVVAIVGILASVTLGYLGDSRKKGVKTAVISNLSTVRAVSNIFYINNNGFLPSGGSTFGIATCPVYNASGTNMLSRDRDMAAAIAEAVLRGGNGSSCYNSANFWAVAVGLDATTSWCVDHSGVSKEVSSAPSSAINNTTFLCN